MTSNNFSPKEIAHLILLSIQGVATQEQQERLEKWLSESDINRKFYKSLENKESRDKRLQEFIRYDSQADWQKVKSQIRKKRKMSFYRYLPYAAIIVVAFSIWGIFRNQHSVESFSSTFENEIVPGCSQACLVLPDGSQIRLKVAQDTFKKLNFVNYQHTLRYNEDTSSVRAEKHILKIPRGGEYHLVLADGTKVWLNAETELSYPAYFQGEKREVELSGEAYFEVAKDSLRPFYVRTADMLVKVIGTSFNIQVYQNEIQQMTLVSGEVEVTKQEYRKIVRPGEQIMIENNRLMLQQVDVKPYIAWKDQRFVFIDDHLDKVLRKLERWYDVQFFIQDEGIRTFRFTGNLPKYEMLSKVLEKLELTTCIHFVQNGHTVIVRKE